MLDGSGSAFGFRFAAIGNSPDFLSARRQHAQGGFRQQQTRLVGVGRSAVSLYEAAMFVSKKEPPFRTTHLHRACAARKATGIACLVHDGIIT
jgi:hypothetical protein